MMRQRIRTAQRQQCHAAQERRDRLAFQPGAAKYVGKTLLAGSPATRCHAPYCEADLCLRLPPQNLPRHGDPRIEMPAGSTAGYHDARRGHAFDAFIAGSAVVTTCVDEACWRDVQRIPIPIRLMSSDEPPALTKGSGMPFVGGRPRTTLMLNNA